MARRRKMTVDEYIQNREDMTFVSVVASVSPETPDEPSVVSYQIVITLDGTYYDKDIAEAQAEFVSKTLGIKRW